MSLLTMSLVLSLMISWAVTDACKQ